MKNLEELSNMELLTISGGSAESHMWGFLIASYVDIEIGMAEGIWRAVGKAWDRL